MPTLETMVSGLKLENPIILASGILGETGKSLERVLNSGAAAVTTKSIGLEPRMGHPNPTIAELDYGLLNAMGLPNPGVDHYLSEIKPILDSKLIVFGSIFGKDHSEFSKLAIKMANAGINALELNLSCPHAKGYGAELGADPKLVFEVTKAVKDAVKIPVFVKLTPNTSDIVSLGRAAVQGGADALVAINTVKSLVIAPELAKPILSNKYGGYSGPGIKPIGLRCVHELASAELGIDIIGVGGIISGTDIVEYLMVGACAVQVGTAVYYHGFETFNKMKSELVEFLDKNGYSSLNEIIGAALKN